MALTIDDLLNSLKNPNQNENDEKGPYLANNADTWRRIGNKDSFAELGLSGSALESFLSEWCANNPYNNI